MIASMFAAGCSSLLLSGGVYAATTAFLNRRFILGTWWVAFSLLALAGALFV